MKKGTRVLLVLLLSFVLVINTAAPVFATEEVQTKNAIQCDSYDQAVEVLREKMARRQTEVVISFEWDNKDSQVIKDLIHKALEHTGVPNQGDYLFWHMLKYSAKWLAQQLDNGRYMLTVTYTITYRSTAEQEAQVDAAVKTLLEQLDVFNASDYQKICAIYDYICNNIRYDTWGWASGDKTVYTAYAALIKKSAVCQGYATLLYRLALELGVDARVISGTGRKEAHGWNIVCVDGKYYNLDSTWDAECARLGLPYEFFMRCDANFAEHTRSEDCNTEQFHEAYVMSETDYDPVAAISAGDMTGDGQVNEEDSIYLLQHVLMPEFFVANQDADLDKNGLVNEEDAIYLLQHVLMPEFFPLK